MAVTGSRAEDPKEARIIPAMSSLLFRRQLSALDEILTTLTDQVAVLDSTEFVANKFREATKSLSEGEQNQLSKAIDSYIEKVSDGDDLITPPLGLLIEANELFDHPRWTRGLWKTAERLTIRTGRQQVIGGSVLVAAIGHFELLFGAFIEYYFRATGASLTSPGDEKRFSLEDLKKFNSIEEAEDLLISINRDKIIRGSLTSWSKWLKNVAEFGLEDVATDWPALNEAYERRNVVVHFGGRVSQQYLDRVGGDSKVGTNLPVDNTYLRKTLSNLRVTGILLVSIGQIKLQKDGAGLVIDKLLDEAYGLLVREDFPAVVAICDALLKLKLSDHKYLMTQVNRCLALQALDPTAVGCPDKKLESDALPPKFELAKFVLCGELDLAMEVAAQLFQKQELDLVALLEWPLLAKLRRRPEYIQLVRKVYGQLATENPPMEEVKDVLLGTTGTRFHARKCRHASSDPEIWLSERSARQMNLLPCGSCQPGDSSSLQLS